LIPKDSFHARNKANRVNLLPFRHTAAARPLSGTIKGGEFMLKKIGGLARALYILLAIIAGFVVLGKMDVTLVLVVLGLVAGLAVPRDRMVLLAALVIALPMVGTALGHIPAIGAQLTGVAGNLQMAAAGSLATTLAIFLYELVMEGVTGLAGNGSAGTTAAAAR
jgi:hypothetical protein